MDFILFILIVISPTSNTRQFRISLPPSLAHTHMQTHTPPPHPVHRIIDHSRLTDYRYSVSMSCWWWRGAKLLLRHPSVGQFVSTGTVVTKPARCLRITTPICPLNLQSQLRISHVTWKCESLMWRLIKLPHYHYLFLDCPSVHIGRHCERCRQYCRSVMQVHACQSTWIFNKNFGCLFVNALLNPQKSTNK